MKNKYNFGFHIDFSVWCFPLAIGIETNELNIGILCFQFEIEIELVEKSSNNL